jgi:predicted tellurium resistance membrane protein TerC
MEAEMVPSLSPLLRAADQWHELLLLLPVLVALEAVLSADNAIALAAISRRLHDPARQRQALNLGLLLALALRFLLIFAARWVLSAWPLQLLASAYLLWLCGRHLAGLDEAAAPPPAADAPAATGQPASAAPGSGEAAAPLSPPGPAEPLCLDSPLASSGQAPAPGAGTTPLGLALESAGPGSGGTAEPCNSAAGALRSDDLAGPGAAAVPPAPASGAAPHGPIAVESAGSSAVTPGPLGPSLASIALTLGLTDLAFSLDSVAAAVAVTDRLALVMLGGLLGVVALRLTAGLFVRWLELFGRLETAGYLAVGLVGIRLLLRLLLPGLVVPEWAVLLIVAGLFLWGFSERKAEPLGQAQPPAVDEAR